MTKLDSRISFMKEPHKKEELEKILNPLVKKWFFSKFNDFSMPQLYGVAEIHNRNNILISAQTGGTKTLTSFLSIINELVNLAMMKNLEDRVYAIYISPLKALNNDIQKNLEEPLKEITALAKEEGVDLDIRVAVRTGDTSVSERQKMLRKSPHILITTPESLALMLSSLKFRELLFGVQWCIIDECLPYNTKITMSNGEKMNIGLLVEKNLKGGKLSSKPKRDITVKTFNPKTAKIEEKKILKVHKIPNLKNLVGISTKNALMSLKLTEDHKVAVARDKEVIWVQAGKIKSGDKIIIDVSKYNNRKTKEINTINKVILTAGDFRKTYLKIFPIKSKYGNSKIKKLDFAIKKLEELELLPLKQNSEKLSVLAKLIGHLFGDGWLCKTEKTSAHAGFSGMIEDLDEIEKDIKYLGFTIHSKSSRNTISLANSSKYGKVVIEGKSNQYLVYSKPLFVLFNMLGVPIGDKTLQPYFIPSWILKSENVIKKNFLSSFLGAESMKPSPSNEGRTHFNAPRISIYKEKTIIGNGKKLAGQFSELFNSFNVKTSSINIYHGDIRKSGVITKKVVITFCNSEDNLYNLYCDLGFSYAKHKEEIAKNLQKYLLYKYAARNRLKEIIRIIKRDFKRGKCYSEISSNLGLSHFKGRKNINITKLCYDLQRTIKTKKQLKGFPRFKDFSKDYLIGDLVLDEVTGVWPIDKKNKFVYDLSVEENHNFIADNFLVHNCHALADNKRGVHLGLSMERLQHQSPNLTRVGLSATVEPIEEVARFLAGSERECKIAKIDLMKKFDLKVLSPVADLVNTTQEKINRELYNLLDQLIQEHKTTLIFTNTRAGTERVVHHLKEHFPKNYTENIGAHHGSLSKKHRKDIEDKLKEGKLKAVVCSTSLELGLDIGYIDLVICLGSPKGVARALQRIGRSGHRLHETVKGRLIAMDRDDLVECSVLLKNAIDKKIDRIDIPKNALDVLAQQIHGMACTEVWDKWEMYNLIKNAYCYSKLEIGDFEEVLNYLAGSFAPLEERYVYAKIWYDPENNKIGKKGKMGRVIHMTNIGTIPDQTGVKVKIGEQVIGTIDEAFLEKLKRGDIFVLGGDTYEFKFSRGNVAQVVSSVGKKPTVPSWYSEMLPLSFDLASDIGKFRRYMLDLFENKKKKEEIIKYINEYLYVDENAANAIHDYFREQYLYAEIPNDKKILVEFYNSGNKDEKKYVIFHSLFGRRVNDALSRSIAYAAARIHHRDTEVGINDNGFYLACPPDKHINATQALELLKPENFEDVMRRSIDGSEVLKRRFRHCAGRALMILRNYKNNRKSVGRQQVSSMILMNAVKRISDNFCILKEARREVLKDLMDQDHAKEILSAMKSGEIEISTINTTVPSPFAFNLVTQGYTDILRMEDKVEFIRRMHQMVLAKIGKKEKI